MICKLKDMSSTDFKDMMELEDMPPTTTFDSYVSAKVTEFLVDGLNFWIFIFFIFFLFLTSKLLFCLLKLFFELLNFFRYLVATGSSSKVVLGHCTASTSEKSRHWSEWPFYHIVWVWRNRRRRRFWLSKSVSCHCGWWHARLWRIARRLLGRNSPNDSQDETKVVVLLDGR